MKDSGTREAFAQLYRLVEKYETAPHLVWTDEGVAYFSEVQEAIKTLFNQYSNNAFVREFCFALYKAIEERYKAANRDGLKDRETQQSMSLEV